MFKGLFRPSGAKVDSSPQSEMVEKVEEPAIQLQEYFTLHAINSRNKVFNFVVSGRSDGKTYSFKDLAYRQWKKTGKLWMYVRRNEDELNNTKKTFWSDYQPLLDDGYEVKVRGMSCMIRKVNQEDVYLDAKGEEILTEDNEWEPFGYFNALSRQQSYKGVPLEKVDKICFDEFIIENKRMKYIPDEYNLLMGLYNTVDRLRELKGEKPLRVYFFSNAGTVSNPYFQHYGIRSTDFTPNGFINRKGKAVFHLFKPSEATIDAKKKTAAYALSDEAYAAYSVDATFLDVKEELITDKPSDASTWAIFTDGKSFFKIYKSRQLSQIYVERVTKLQNGVNAFTFDRDQIVENAPYEPAYLTYLLGQVDRRSIRFNSPDTRAVFLDLLL